jgi:hypothetical protein
MANFRVGNTDKDAKGRKDAKGARRRCALCILCVLVCVHPASAQSVSLGVGLERDRFTYHFDNRSSFDTAELVPHFFEQRYVADNLWLAGVLRYHAGIDWETSGGVTPRRTGTGDDYDSFFNPDGTVIVSGTTGGIAIRSWRLGQRAVAGRSGPIAVVTGYRLRVDNADWQLGHSTTTRNGVLVDAHDTVDREYTRSAMHQISTGLQIRSAEGRRWQTRVDAELSPAVIGRLLIQLPDKYPGRDLVFLSKGGAAAVALSISHRRSPVPFTLAADVLRTWSYRSTAQLSRNTIAIRVTIG